MREAIPIDTRLFVTFRFSANGDSYLAVMYTSGISVPALSTVIPSYYKVTERICGGE
jgi:hypothetical protein